MTSANAFHFVKSKLFLSGKDVNDVEILYICYFYTIYFKVFSNKKKKKKKKERKNSSVFNKTIIIVVFLRQMLYMTAAKL